jgi:hypothetical protein
MHMLMALGAFFRHSVKEIAESGSTSGIVAFPDSVES